jgi:hypothetical protein
VLSSAKVEQKLETDHRGQEGISGNYRPASGYKKTILLSRSHKTGSARNRAEIIECGANLE